LKEDSWFGLYAEGWGDTLVPEAFAHPAKVRPALARKIYEHAMEEGWLEPGMTVLDPFFGIGGFAFHALVAGLNIVGFELEPRFVELANQNIELWRRTYAPHFPRYGEAHVYQGDSRYLSLLLSLRPQAVASSPPYVSGGHHNGVFETWGGDADKQGGCAKWATKEGGYGGSSGQLGSMPEGDPAAVISSPPYAGSVNQSDGANDAQARKDRKAAAGVDISKPINVGGPNSALNRPQVYGNTDGQLGAMPAGCISSPPYAGSEQSRDADFTLRSTDVNPSERRLDTRSYFPAEMDTPGNLAAMDACVSSPPYEGNDLGGDSQRRLSGSYSAEENKDLHKGKGFHGTYGAALGQLAIERAETFWSAARQVVEQVYDCLVPGGHAIWVLKAYVRDKEVVDFPGQWQAMCESCGFVTEHIHKAWMVEERGVQLDLFGNEHEQRTERKSFFRRLYESKYPENRIDYEIVLCMSK